MLPHNVQVKKHTLADAELTAKTCSYKQEALQGESISAANGLKSTDSCLAILELWSLLSKLFLPHPLFLVVYQIVQRKHTAEQQLAY